MRKEVTEEQRVQRAVAAIMNDDRFRMLSGLLLLGKREIIDDAEAVPTAGTDGKNEIYNRAFVKDLSDAELRFLILHEVYHKMYRHLTTWRHLHLENASKANVAMDYVINIQLRDADPEEKFIRMPADGFVSSKYRGWDTHRVFNDLSDPDSPEGGFDTHDWEAAQSMTPEEQRNLSQTIDRAIQQGALQASKTGGQVNRDILELTRPQVDWKTALRQYMQTLSNGRDYSTWRRPSRRFLGSGYYMPSSISESIGDIVIGVDTSGSIGEKALTAFISEVQSACDEVKPANVHLIYWGHQVDCVEIYTRDELSYLASSTKPLGGGGTDVTCLSEYIAKHSLNPEAVIVLTDGYLAGSWGTWSAPVLWGILDNQHASPTVGTTLHINTRS